MTEDQRSDQKNQDTQFRLPGVGQPSVKPNVTPKQTDPTSQQQRTQEGTNPAKPVFVQLVGGDELEPFEEQTLAISRETLTVSRRTYQVAIFAFLAALAAAVFVGSQVKIMSYQTQIMASQSESAAAGAAIGELNTRNQFKIAQEQADASQKQAKAAETQVDTLRRNFVNEQQPYVWFTNETAIVDWTEWKGGTASWTYRITNYGKSPAINYSVDRHTEIGPDALEKVKNYRISRQFWSWKGSRLPQGKDDLFSSYAKISGKDWEQAKAHDQWIVTVGTFIYSDLSGVLHADDFCVSYLANGLVMYCEYKHKTQ
jgi:hypothetical protein